MRRVALAAAVVAAIAPAGALAAPAGEAVVAVDGRAELKGDGSDEAERKEARVRALDAAFATAVEGELAKLLDAPRRKRNHEILRERIIRRARLFVARYKVRDEAAEAGSYRVSIDATIDVGKLRGSLVELGLVQEDGGAAPAAGGRPRMLLLLSAATGEGRAATFGPEAGDGGPVGRAFAAELAAQGFELGSAGELPAPAVEAPLPIEAADAATAATRAGAGGAFVVSVGAGEAGRIRGTPLQGAEAHATVLIVDADGAVVARSEHGAAGFAAGGSEAATTAAREAAMQAARSASAAAAGRWPAAAAVTGATRVVVVGLSGWAPVDVVSRALAGVRGVAAVAPRRFRTGEVELAVSGDVDPKRLAAAVTGAGMGLAARVDRGAVVVDASAFTPPAPVAPAAAAPAGPAVPSP